MANLQSTRRRPELRSAAAGRPPAGAEALERVLHDLDASPLGVVGDGAPAVSAWLRRRGHDTAPTTLALRPAAGQARAARPADRWAAIVAVNWVEQIPDPAAFLRQARRVLSPDGRFVAVVPNITHASLRLAAASRRGSPPIPRHPFTAADVERLLNSAGFMVTGVTREVDTIERLRQLGRGLADSVLDVLAEDADAMTSYFVFVAEPFGGTASPNSGLDLSHLAAAQQAAAHEADFLRQRIDAINRQLLTLTTDSGAPVDRVERLEQGASHALAQLRAAASALDDVRSHVGDVEKRLASAEDEARVTREEARAAAERITALEHRAAARDTRIEAARDAMATRAREMEGLVATLERARYRRLVGRVRDLVRQAVPPRAKVLVVSRGDDELVTFDKRTGWHFPRTATGVYAGHHPADSGEAIARLEAARKAGARFLVIPQPSSWWLDHYREFAQHLEQRCRCVIRDEAGVVYALGGRGR
jgi:SAM-dependent methyltransferase